MSDTFKVNESAISVHIKSIIGIRRACLLSGLLGNLIFFNLEYCKWQLMVYIRC